jgi:hypothetical protein
MPPLTGPIFVTIPHSATNAIFLSAFASADILGPLSHSVTRLLQISIVPLLLASGCSSVKVSNQSAGLPLGYHNARYDLTFYLPPSWRNYSVSIEQVDDERYSPAEDKLIIVGHTPMITLRHPQWRDDAPYQDIPILVFTRSQWDALNHGQLWPSAYAGGVMDELWHSRRFVFAISSRYNAADEVKGWKEAADIVEQNCAANKMPRLYPQ